MALNKWIAVVSGACLLLFAQAMLVISWLEGDYGLGVLAGVSAVTGVSILILTEPFSDLSRRG